MVSQQQSILHYQWQLADIAEMNPDFDLDYHTAKVAARLIYEMVKAKFIFLD
ncbi:hypothetical protein QX776_03765 [Alteromonadaceae bacterium BrNp21-10]|nr:hypothetical protein [Alteromonadaceae bacterium BrNp21-10]